MSSQAFNPEIVSSYADKPFNDLPGEVQEAARILGYNAEVWDGGMVTAQLKKNWTELEEPIRQAATTLGYTQEKWDRIKVN